MAKSTTILFLLPTNLFYLTWSNISCRSLGYIPNLYFYSDLQHACSTGNNGKCFWWIKCIQRLSCLSIWCISASCKWIGSLLESVNIKVIFMFALVIIFWEKGRNWGGIECIYFYSAFSKRILKGTNVLLVRFLSYKW